MAKFTKFRNPNRRRRVRRSQHSQEYICEREKELYKLLANAKDDEEKELLWKAFDVTINP